MSFRFPLRDRTSPTETAAALLRAAMQRARDRCGPFQRQLFGAQGAALCFVLALAVYGLESLAWPLAPGRDAGTYLLYYLDMWTSHPVYPALMLFRTPLAPLVFGPLLQLGGAALAEVAMAVLFGLSIVAFVAAASTFGRRCCVITAAALLLYPPYGALFHQLSSDPVFAAMVAAFALQAARIWRNPSGRGFATAALLVLGLVLARPSGEIFLAFALAPLLLAAPLRSRLRWSATFAGASLALLASFAGYNWLRYDDFTISRMGNALVPFYRTFVVDRIVLPGNGPASRELAAAVKSDLLHSEPYAAYGIDSKTFFSSGSVRMFADLVALSDREWGWNSHYTQLRDSAVEAIRAHPKVYVRGVTRTLELEMRGKYAYVSPRSTQPASHAASRGTIVVRGRRLPAPTEGEPIPASNLWWLASTPRGTLWTDWSSFATPTTRSHEAGGDARIRALEKRLAALEDDLPNRDGSLTIANGLNSVTNAFPGLLFWVVVGTLGFAVRRFRGAALPTVLLCTAGLVLIGTALGEPPVIEYRIPFDPLFLLFGVAGVAGVDSCSAQDASRLR